MKNIWVKHKFRYICETAIFFYLLREIIKDSCNLNIIILKLLSNPAVLDGGDEIILANWLINKSIKFTINNNISIKLPDYSNVLVNRTIYVIVN